MLHGAVFFRYCASAPRADALYDIDAFNSITGVKTNVGNEERTLGRICGYSRGSEGYERSDRRQSILEIGGAVRVVALNIMGWPGEPAISKLRIQNTRTHCSSPPPGRRHCRHGPRIKPTEFIRLANKRSVDQGL